MSSILECCRHLDVGDVARICRSRPSDSRDAIYEFQLTAPDLRTPKQYLPTFESEVASFEFRCHHP
jgi:hypothetical protein